MNHDLRYFKERVIQLTASYGSPKLPQEQSLRASLATLGDVWYIQVFPASHRDFYHGQYDTAVVVFRTPAGVSRARSSSQNSGTFLKSNSIQAHTLKKSGIAYETFLTEIIPKLRLESQVAPPASGGFEGQSTTLSGRGGPPLKRPRIGDCAPDSSNTLDETTTGIESSHTPSATSESVERMRTRVAQLEAELDSARASREKAISEKSAFQTAYYAEQKLSRQSTSQKMAAEAALTLEKAKYDHLRAEFEAGSLYGPATGVDDRKRNMARLCPCESGSNSQVQALKGELKEARSRHLEDQQYVRLVTIELDDAKSTIQQLTSKVEQSQLDLASTREQLESTKQALESMERKYVLILEESQRANESLETYKIRLENEEGLMQKLQDTLIPEVHNSLGATQATLSAFLSAMSMSQTKKQSDVRSD